MCPGEGDNLSISGLHVYSLPSVCLPCERVILDSGELPKFLIMMKLLLWFFYQFRYWDTRQPNPVHTQQLPDRCYSMAVRHPLMVVGTADRNLIVFNLQTPQVLFSIFPITSLYLCISCNS